MRFDAVTRALYSTDASIYEIEPIGVVLPQDADDVQAVLEITRAARVPVLPRGGGTSLAGQAVGHAVVLDFSKYMNQVLEINAEARWARVQPGLVRNELAMARRRRVKSVGVREDREEKRRGPGRPRRDSELPVFPY